MLNAEYNATAAYYRDRANTPPPPPPPRPFDGVTEQSVRKVQRENHLPETGRVDADTLRTLRARSPSLPSGNLGEKVDNHGMVGPGDEGSEIEELNGLLEGYAKPAPTPAPSQVQPEGGSLPSLPPAAQPYMDKAPKAQDQGNDLLGRPAEAAVNGLNSDGDKAIVKIKGSLYAGIGMEGMGKKATKPIEKSVSKATDVSKKALENLDRLKRPGSSWFDNLVNKGVEKAHNLANGAVDTVQGAVDKGVKPVADLVDSIKVGQKLGGELNAEVSAKQTPGGGLEYEVKVKKAVDTATIAALPVKLEGWGAEMDVNGEAGRGVAMEETYTFKSKEDAIKGLKLLEVNELIGDHAIAGKSGGWLDERKTWTNIEITQNLNGGVTGTKEEIQLPSWVPDLGVVGLSGTVEGAGKLELSTKVTYKFSEQPGVANQVVREFKGVTKAETSARLVGDIVNGHGSVGATATLRENEFTIEAKDEFRSAEDFAKLLGKLPKEVEIKGSTTRFQDTWRPDGTRMDSTKVEFSKTVPFDRLDVGQEAGKLLRTLSGNTEDAKPFEDAGYKTTRKFVDASGFSGNATLGATIPAEFVPVTLLGSVAVEVGRDDSTKVG